MSRNLLTIASRRRTKLERLKAAEKERLGQRPPLACMFWLLQVGSTINTSNTITSGTISNITLENLPSTQASVWPCWTSSTPASRQNTHWEAYTGCEEPCHVIWNPKNEKQNMPLNFQPIQCLLSSWSCFWAVSWPDFQVASQDLHKVTIFDWTKAWLNSWKMK